MIVTSYVMCSTQGRRTRRDVNEGFSGFCLNVLFRKVNSREMSTGLKLIWSFYGKLTQTVSDRKHDILTMGAPKDTMLEKKILPRWRFFFENFLT